MKIKWNDDKSEATISADDLKELQTNAQGNFDKGFGAGAEKGRKEILDVIKPLNITTDDLPGSITAIKKKLDDFENGAIPPEKLKESDLVKSLNEKAEELKKMIEQKNEAFANLEKKHEDFRRSTLIDTKLEGLARNNKAIDGKEEKIVALFKMDYDVSLDQSGSVVLRDKKTGKAIMDDKGNDATLDGIFDRFKTDNSYLFAADGQNGGSGGGNNTPPSGVSLKDLKTDAQKAEFMEKHGLDAFKQLVIGENSKE